MMRRAETTAVLVHCSDSPGGSARDIEDWHRGRGFETIGYHYVIENGRSPGGRLLDPARDGLIVAGRDEALVGAHEELANLTAVGVCLVGRDWFTANQRASLYGLLATILYRYRMGFESVLGHYELDEGRTCPNLDLERVRAKLALVVGQFNAVLRSQHEIGAPV